jgi:hypothetical protein
VQSERHHLMLSFLLGSWLLRQTSALLVLQQLLPPPPLLHLPMTQSLLLPVHLSLLPPSLPLGDLSPHLTSWHHPWLLPWLVSLLLWLQGWLLPLMQPLLPHYHLPQYCSQMLHVLVTPLAQVQVLPVPAETLPD